MRRVMVRYRVRPERVAENEALVRAVYEELARTEPDGSRYATFRLDDGVTFFHLAIGDSPLAQLAAFRRFRERCDERPVASELHEVGSFGMA